LIETSISFFESSDPEIETEDKADPDPETFETKADALDTSQFDTFEALDFEPKAVPEPVS